MSYLSWLEPCLQILPQELPKKYITYAKLNISPRLDDLKMVKDELSETYAELQRKSSVILYLIFFCLPNYIVVISCIQFF